jgi:serine protease AprX
VIAPLHYRNRPGVPSIGLYFFIFIAPLIFNFINAAELRGCFKKIRQQDSVCLVWVLFSDKNSQAGVSAFSSHALARRAKAGFPASSFSDLPVNQFYIKEIANAGGRLRNVVPWLNGASFSVHSSKIASLAKMRFVKDILPVRSFSEVLQAKKPSALKKTTASADSSKYGHGFHQMNMPNIPAAHDYLVNTVQEVPGSGVIIGLFDSGFRLTHRSLDYIREHKSIIGDSNFVNQADEVADPVHGMWTLSLIAGYDPGKYMGVAWGATFVLAHTEWYRRKNAAKDIEVHGEEDNWAAALFWAESKGADIISSSLAYKTDFTDSLGNPRPQDDYTINDLDGKTTIISKAALEATKRGIIIVNSSGNDGQSTANCLGTLNAPADVNDVVSVGGVDASGKISYFSSCGPTADGRIKPDVVTQAQDIFLPDYGDDTSYFIGEQGTSFSAPVVAGICGLIRQTHPRDPAALIRKRLYESCVFSPFQDSVDNRYGRGVPDALKACRMDTLLVKNEDIAFVACPTVIDIIRKNQKMQVTISLTTGKRPTYPLPVKLAVMSMSGSLLWSRLGVLSHSEPVTIRWPESQTSYAPGMYYFIATYAGKTSLKKFIILG